MFRSYLVSALLSGLLSTSIYAQASVTNHVGYSSFDAAVTAAPSGATSIVAEPYATEYGSYVTWTVTSQPLFADDCDLLGASGTPPEMSWTGTCTGGITGSTTHDETTLSALKSWISSHLLSSRERKASNIVRTGTLYTVVYPVVVEACQ